MIIVDGMDKTGKTTLCERLVKKYPRLHLFRLTRFEGGLNFEEHKRDYWDEFTIMKKSELKLMVRLREERHLSNLVLDRFLASEYAYIEEEEKKDLDYIWDLDMRLACISPPCVIILLHAPKSYLLKIFDDEEAKMTLDSADRYIARFHEYGEKTAIPQLQLDISTYNEDEVFIVAENFLLSWVPYAMIGD